MPGARNQWSVISDQGQAADISLLTTDYCHLQNGQFVVTLEHDPEKWEPVFGKRSCSNKKLERDDDSKKSHPALADEAQKEELIWPALGRDPR
jgi:hypothetical protein